ncbi:hypothetical protein [Nocardiopsis ansamitocini]|uniref:Uncharacterized protein n=1 Tax=Nocardiopsis ansamitocini TaxID=1670832 RepID=A0A9W6P5N1_9ACTN|nr:hypothetical protein [Nocardiopsis ansamitocini]GLU47514.1 hypothetical protein Nans01_18650 [Nocardiopsis ansamitocini]
MPRRLIPAMAVSAAVATVVYGAFATVSPALAADSERGMEAAVTSSGTTRTLLPGSLAYTCAAENGAGKSYTAELSITAPGELRSGESAEVRLARFTGYFDRWITEPIAEGDAVLSAQVRVGGKGADVRTVTLTGANPAASPAGKLPLPRLTPVEFGPVVGSVRATTPGEITFAPGPVTITVHQRGDELVTVCSPKDEADPVATTLVVAEQEEEEEAPGPTVTPAVAAPGRTEWSGTYRCASSDPGLQPDFESPATVTVTTTDTGYPVGERIEAVGEFTLERGLKSPMKLGPGAVTAELEVALSGPAVSTRRFVLRTENSGGLPAGQDILLPTAAGYFTPDRPGAVELAVKGLELSFLGGILTVDCRVRDDTADEAPVADLGSIDRVPVGTTPPVGPPDPGQQDAPVHEQAREAPLPVTGAALGGLIAFAGVALACGGVATLAARKRHHRP